jgi:Zn-dependent protease/CBS domain-containing protein
MKWSWKVGRFAGIDVHIHSTFFLLLGFIGLANWLAERTLAGTLAGVGFMLALFGCVLLHEFGHALTARRYGIKTRDITLLPIGGVARLERMPEDPKQELSVALAGPAVNVVIAGVLYLWLASRGVLEPITSLSVSQGSFLERVMIVNVTLAAFNLVPAFPMDGGRVARALLAMRMEYTRATQIAAALGQGLALILGFIGLFSDPFLLFIALFVWIGAAQEASMAQMKSALGGIPVSRAMVTDFETVAETAPLGTAVDVLLRGAQEDFPVTRDGELVGILERRGLVAGLTQYGRDVPVAKVMRTDYSTVEAAGMLEAALVTMQTCGCETLPVLREGRLAGLLTKHNVGEFLAVQSALEAATRGSARPLRQPPAKPMRVES